MSNSLLFLKPQFGEFENLRLWRPLDIGIDCSSVPLGIVSILDDSAPHNLCRMLTFSANAGSIVSFLQLLENKSVVVGLMDGRVCLTL